MRRRRRRRSPPRPGRRVPGVFGIARTTATPSPAAPRSAASDTPAAIDRIRRSPRRAPRRPRRRRRRRGFTAITAAAHGGTAPATVTPGNCAASSSRRVASASVTASVGGSVPAASSPPTAPRPCSRRRRSPARSDMRANATCHDERPVAPTAGRRSPSADRVRTDSTFRSRISSHSWRVSGSVATRGCRNPRRPDTPDRDRAAQISASGRRASASRSGWRSRSAGAPEALLDGGVQRADRPGRARPPTSARPASSPRRNTASSTPIEKCAPTSRSLRRSRCSYSSASFSSGAGIT